MDSLPSPVPRDTVLIVAPTHKDGETTCALLARFGVASVICRDLRQAAEHIRSTDAAAAVLTEDAIMGRGVAEFVNILQQQPAWSDLPIIMLMHGGQDAPVASPILRALRNVTLLERPAPMRSLASAVQAAVRARRRQYEIREQLLAVQRAEARSRELQKQLEIAVDASELGTFHCDMPLGKIIWNNRCKAHFWLPPEAEVDMDLFYSILHPDDRERSRRAVEKCVYGGDIYDIEYRSVSPEGKIRWIRATGRTARNAQQQPTRFDGTTQDITQRKVAQEELRNSQEHFQAMANSIPQLAWMARPDGWIFWYNKRWHDYTGKTLEDMQGWGWESVHDPRELPRIIEPWKAALAAGKPWEDTFPLRRHDGQFRWHLSRAMPFRDGSGDIILWFGTNTDITDERTRALEREQLLQSERAARADSERAGRLKDEFLATLSHELRTPLNAILGWSQLIRREKDPATIEEGMGVIERNARVQVQLIEDLLDMSRIISGKIRLDVQQIDPAGFIEAAIETVRPAADAREIRLRRVLDPQAGPVAGDPNRLQQVIWNLLSNAIKFTPRGGSVQVVLSRINSHIEISVTDSGQGISPEFLPHVFERFRQADASTTRNHGGLGLGLAIVKHLAELHGGTIRANSAGPGQGSVFTVELPLSVVRREPAVAPGVHPRAALAGPAPQSGIDCQETCLAGMNILVVDDEPDARNLIKRVLEECEARVVTAASAAEALALVSTEHPDVLVTDIGMPGTDGYELLRRIRALGTDHGGNIPAIALTAFARSEDRTRVLMAGFAIHVSKPVEPQELIATVATVGGRTPPKNSE